MNGKTQTSVALALFCIGSFCALLIFNGCVYQGYPNAPLTPVNLARQIADADQIVITNRFLEREIGVAGFSASVSGQEVTTVVNAISTAARVGLPLDAIMNCELEFYNATNHLATVRFQQGAFAAENAEYVDDSGVLEKLYSDFYKQGSVLEK